MTQLPIWTRLRPTRRWRWTPRCDDCGRKIWSTRALVRRFGLLLGDTCYRRRVQAALRLKPRIRVTNPGHIPGQLDLTDQET